MTEHSLGRDDARPSGNTIPPRFTPGPWREHSHHQLGPDAPLVRMAWEVVSQAHNATNLAYSCFADLATLFQAISDASAEHSQAAKLAKIGLYLAEDWANLHDSERESLEPRMAALRAALGFSPIPDEGGAK